MPRSFAIDLSEKMKLVEKVNPVLAPKSLMDAAQKGSKEEG
jgi:hypothetical protein